jgi:hypothetical protein
MRVLLIAHQDHLGVSSDQPISGCMCLQQLSMSTPSSGACCDTCD